MCCTQRIQDRKWILTTRTAPKRAPGQHGAPDATRNSLRTGHGLTTVTPEAVAKIVGLAVQDVPGIHALGAGAARAIGNLRERVGQKDLTQGIKVEVGTIQVAVDLTLVVEYPHPIQNVATQTRTVVYEAIENLVGLEVVEVNIVVTDIHTATKNTNTTETIESAPRVR